MSIILQSTVGGFSNQFMHKLPLVEQAMRDHGLEPSEFVISKDYASTASYPIMGPFFFNLQRLFRRGAVHRHRAERHGVSGLLPETGVRRGRPAGAAAAAGPDAAPVRLDGAAGVASYFRTRRSTRLVTLVARLSPVYVLPPRREIAPFFQRLRGRRHDLQINTY